MPASISPTLRALLQGNRQQVLGPETNFQGLVPGLPQPLMRALYPENPEIWGGSQRPPQGQQQANPQPQAAPAPSSSGGGFPNAQAIQAGQVYGPTMPQAGSFVATPQGPQQQPANPYLTPQQLSQAFQTGTSAGPAAPQSSGGLSLAQVQQMVAQARGQQPAQQGPTQVNLMNRALGAQSPINPALSQFGGQAPTLDQWMGSIDQFRPFTTPGLEQYVSNHAANPGSTAGVYQSLAGMYPNILGQITAGEQAATGRMGALGNLGLGIGNQALQAAEQFGINGIPGMMANRALQASTDANRSYAELYGHLIENAVATQGLDAGAAANQLRQAGLPTPVGWQAGNMNPQVGGILGAGSTTGNSQPGQQGNQPHPGLNTVFQQTVRTPGLQVQMGPNGQPNLMSMSREALAPVITQFVSGGLQQGIPARQMLTFMNQRFGQANVNHWLEQTTHPFNGILGFGVDRNTANTMNSFFNALRNEGTNVQQQNALPPWARITVGGLMTGTGAVGTAIGGPAGAAVGLPLMGYGSGLAASGFSQ